MTSDRDIKDICSTLRQTSLHAAADLIEQLQRELDEAYREAKRLAEIVWRDHYKEKAPNWQPLDTTAGIISQIDNMIAGLVEQLKASRKEGFRAGIEAAAEKAQIFMLGLSKERSDKMQKAILALTPTDKPAAPSVAEAENDGPYTCRSCCAATWNDSDVCDDCALAAREADTPPSDSKEIAG